MDRHCADDSSVLTIFVWHELRAPSAAADDTL